MKRIDRAPAIDREQLFRPRADFAFRFAKFGMIRRWPLADLGRQINRQRVRQNKVAIGQALHERARAEAIRAVIGKIRFTDHMQTRDIAHQIVIHPQAAHRVMQGRINSHWAIVGVFPGDLFVDVKKISVTFPNRLFT